jgi:hypothetical protein
MRIDKCDLCRKIIKDRKKSVHVGTNFIFHLQQFCFPCIKKLLSKQGQELFLKSSDKH